MSRLVGAAALLLFCSTLVAVLHVMQGVGRNGERPHIKALGEPLVIPSETIELGSATWGPSSPSERQEVVDEDLSQAYEVCGRVVYEPSSAAPLVDVYWIHSDILHVPLSAGEVLRAARAGQSYNKVQTDLDGRFRIGAPHDDSLALVAIDRYGRYGISTTEHPFANERLVRIAVGGYVRGKVVTRKSVSARNLKVIAVSGSSAWDIHYGLATSCNVDQNSEFRIGPIQAGLVSIGVIQDPSLNEGLYQIVSKESFVGQRQVLVLDKEEAYCDVAVEASSWSFRVTVNGEVPRLPLVLSVGRPSGLELKYRVGNDGMIVGALLHNGEARIAVRSVEDGWTYDAGLVELFDDMAIASVDVPVSKRVLLCANSSGVLSGESFCLFASQGIEFPFAEVSSDSDGMLTLELPAGDLLIMHNSTGVTRSLSWPPSIEGVSF